MDSYFDTQHAKQLIYGGEMYSEEDYESMLDKIDDFPRGTEHGCRRPSLYLRLFEDMVNTVYQHESHLLSESEWDVFATLGCYCYNARYCLIRLVLRKPDQWHALSSLGSYKKEVGDVGLIRAITDLCKPWAEVMNGTKDMKEEMEVDGVDLPKDAKGVIDLTFDEDEDVKIPTIHVDASLNPSTTSHSSRSSSTLSSSDFPENSSICEDDFPEVPLDSFCYDENSMDTAELLSRLSVKQLKDLIKATKTKSAKNNKPEMIRALLANAATQRVLELPASPAQDNLRRPLGPYLRKIPLPLDAKARPEGKEKTQKNQEQRLVQMVLKILGKCVKVNGDFYRLVRRLHLICFRCTEQPTSLLLPVLLTSFRKRTYPQFRHKRDKSIWPTREDLLDYEEALDLEAKLEEVASKVSEREMDPKTPTPATLVGKILRTPRMPFVTPKDLPLFSSGGKEEPEVWNDGAPVLPEVVDVEKEEVNVRKAKKVKAFMDENIYPRWKEFIEAKGREGCSARKPGLERFEPGYIYTRMLHHASRSLATLKEYQAEYKMMEELLAQKLYRRGSRAKWYERRAILQMMYLSKTEGRKRDQDVLKQAMEGVKEALADEDIGIVWRPSLFHRLQRLEKMLHIQEEECTPPEVELRQPKRVFVKAARAMKRENSVPMAGDSRSANAQNGGLHSYFTPKRRASEPREPEEPMPKEEEKENATKKAKIPSWKGKSLWVGRDNEVVHVEIRVLQYYESLGFKGLHSESLILTTIFSLLFWDIIFADVSGAFETPYQTAPLDLAEDTFYYTRKEMIEARLKVIRDGNAREILEGHDDQQREKQTMCTGLRWDICDIADLVEIVECLGGYSLSVICRLFCEDYGGRSSGVPDLVIWSADQGICKFVEVKGPGDRPQENQKLWFDSLLRAGANVEICHVIDINAPPKDKRKTPGTGRKRKAQPKPDSSPDGQEDGEGNQRLDDEEDWVPRDAEGSLPRKQRRRDDVLPSYFRGDFQTPCRLPRDVPNLNQIMPFVVETPCKSRRG